MATDFFDKASLVLIPSGYKAGILYSIKPDDGTGDFSISRASEATRRNENGVWENMAEDVPRLQYPACPSLLLEQGRTNLFLNSDAPVTQTVTLVNGTEYVVSCYGTGSIELTDAAVGTVTEGNDVLFTALSTSLTCTVSGTLTNAQVEEGAYSTSPIITAGTSVTRIRDTELQCGFTGMSTGNSFTIFYEFSKILPNDGNVTFTVFRFRTGNSVSGEEQFRLIAITSSSGLAIYDTINSTYPYGTDLPAGGINNSGKIAITYDGTLLEFAVDGAMRGTGYSPAIQLAHVDFLHYIQNCNKTIEIKQTWVFDDPLTHAEMEEITT